MTQPTSKMTFEEKLASDYVAGKIQNYLEAKEYTKQALIARKNYQKVGSKDYNPENEPKLIRDGASISHENVKSGVSGTLFQNVEHIPLDAAYKISKIFDLPEDQPIIPYVEALIRKYDLDKTKNADPTSPSPS